MSCQQRTLLPHGEIAVDERRRAHTLHIGANLALCLLREDAAPARLAGATCILAGVVSLAFAG